MKWAEQSDRRCRTHTWRVMHRDTNWRVISVWVRYVSLSDSNTKYLYAANNCVYSSILFNCASFELSISVRYRPSRFLHRSHRFSVFTTSSIPPSSPSVVQCLNHCYIWYRFPYSTIDFVLPIFYISTLFTYLLWIVIITCFTVTLRECECDGFVCS